MFSHTKYRKFHKQTLKQASYNKEGSITKKNIQKCILSTDVTIYGQMRIQPQTEACNISVEQSA
jgi:hypothetical protein